MRAFVVSLLIVSVIAGDIPIKKHGKRGLIFGGHSHGHLGGPGIPHGVGHGSDIIVGGHSGYAPNFGGVGGGYAYDVPMHHISHGHLMKHVVVKHPVTLPIPVPKPFPVLPGPPVVLPKHPYPVYPPTRPITLPIHHGSHGVQTLPAPVQIPVQTSVSVTQHVPLPIGHGFGHGIGYGSENSFSGSGSFSGGHGGHDLSLGSSGLGHSGVSSGSFGGHGLSIGSTSVPSNSYGVPHGIHEHGPSVGLPLGPITLPSKSYGVPHVPIHEHGHSSGFEIGSTSVPTKSYGVPNHGFHGNGHGSDFSVGSINLPSTSYGVPNTDIHVGHHTSGEEDGYSYPVPSKKLLI